MNTSWLPSWLPGRRVHSFDEELMVLIAKHTDIMRGDLVMSTGDIVNVLLDRADRLNEARIAGKEPKR